MKRIFTFILAMVMLVGMLPTTTITAYATETEEVTVAPEHTEAAADAAEQTPPVKATASAAQSGVCGDNLTWRINETGNLVISGTGPMYDYSEENPAPWASVTEGQTGNHWVYMEPGITRIGDYAFARMKDEFIWIDLPVTVKEIGSRAFINMVPRLFLSSCDISFANDAFSFTSATYLHYGVGWSTSVGKKYGATNAYWNKATLSQHPSSKMFFAINEEVKPEDFSLLAYHDRGITYQAQCFPYDLQIGEYDNSTPGTKTITVTADGEAFSYTYIVVEGDPLKDVQAEPIAPIYYDPDALTPAPVVTLGGITLAENVHYTLTYKNNYVGGDASVTITGIGYMEGFSITVPFAILKTDLSSATLYCGKQEYCAQALTPDVDVKLGSRYLTQGTDYVIYYENNINKGTASYRVVGIGNYCGTATGTFTIGDKDRYFTLNGAYNGQSGGKLNDEHHYSEFVINPSVFKGQVNATIDHHAYSHVAVYELYRMDQGSPQLIDYYSSPYGSSTKTIYTYDFSKDYTDCENTGGAVYMLTYSWVDSADHVFSGVCMIGVYAKVADASLIGIEMPENVGNYRYGYMNAYSLNGNLGKVTWSSSNPSVATIKDGQLVMHQLGETVITAKSGNVTADIPIAVMAEYLSQGTIYSYDAATGKAVVLYDGYQLEENTDYTLAITTVDGQTQVTVTGIGVFQGQLVQSYDAQGNALDHCHGFASTCATECMRCVFKREPATQHSYTWGKTRDMHWKECIHCGKRIESAAHTLSGTDNCSVCGQLPAAQEQEELPETIDTGNLLTSAPLAGSTVAIYTNGLVMGKDIAGNGLAFTLGQVTDGQLAITEDMAQLKVRSEGSTYQFLLDGKYLTCGVLGDYLYLSDTLTDYGRWVLEEGPDNSFYILNVGSYLNGTQAMAFYYGFSAYDAIAHPFWQLQLYQIGTQLEIPSNVTKLDTPKMVSPSSSTVLGEVFLEWNYVPYATGYEVYRATSKSGKYTKVATVDTTYWESTVPAGKTYYFKVKAICSAKPKAISNFSSAAAFIGKFPAPVLKTKFNAGTGRTELSWQKVEGAKKYEIYRALYGEAFKKIATTSKLSYIDTKAKTDATYFYKIRAVGSSSSYNGDYSQEVEVRHSLPAPKVTVTFDAATGSPIFSWKKVTGADAYYIRRCVSGTENWFLLGYHYDRTFKDTSADRDAVYDYQIIALGKSWDVNESAGTSLTLTIPLAQVKPTGSTNAAGQPTLTWSAVEKALHYEIYRSTKSNKSYTKIATVESLSYVDDTFSAGATYYYKVVAVGETAKSPYSAYVKLNGKCGTPVISVKNDSSGKPSVSWEKVTGAKQYTVYRATSETGKYSNIGTTKTTAYVDKKASVGKTYFYKVVANGSKSNGNSGYSNIVSCSVRLPAPKIKLWEPSDVYGDPLISWESVSGAKGYRILRKIPGEAEFTVIKEWTENYFRDSTAELFAEYTYVVQTIGSKPEYDSIYTQEMTILSSMGKPSTTCLSKNNGASLDWNAVEGAVSYDVFVSTVSEKEGFTLLLNTTSTYYLHTEVQPNKIYYYKVVAIGQGGLRVEGSVHKLHIRCATPRVTLELDAVSGKPVLSWEAVDGATKGYEIYRATYGGKLKKLKTVKTLRFVDTSATAGGDYRYEVRALGSGKDYNSKWEETGYIVAKCAQPKATVKLNKSGDPVVSWKKVSGAKQYIVMYVDVTDFALNGTEPSEAYLQQHMQYTTTTKTSVTLKTPGDRMYLITMIAVPKYADAHSTPSDPLVVITE